MSQAPETTGSADPDPDGEPPRRRGRMVMTVLTIAAVAVLVAMVGIVVTNDPLGDRRLEPSPAAPTNPSGVGGGTDDPWRPDNAGDLGSGAATEAAATRNWPLVAGDEFGGTGLDPAKWGAYTGETTGGIGRHRAENIAVRDGKLVITSEGLSSGGLAWQGGQQYGRWEVRAKTNKGSGYGDVVLLWPDAEDWPEGGEVNFMEIPKGERNETHFIVHYGEDNSQVGHTTRGDFTQWHNYAVEWTPDHVAGYIDGREIFRTTDPDAIPPRPMHLAMQQDIGPYGKDWIPAPDSRTPDRVDFEVDWVRIYGL